MVQMVEGLPNKHKALSSNHYHQKKLQVKSTLWMEKMFAKHLRKGVVHRI
jgi:hypothetical protein